MSNSAVVYNAVESYEMLQQKVSMIAVFVLFLSLVYIIHSFMHKTPKRVESKAPNVDNRIESIFIFFFCFLIASIFLGHTHSSAAKAKGLLETQSFNIVEGVYLELEKKGKTSYFSVANTTFNYASSGALNPGRFDNDCTREGCLIQSGDKVRVTHANLEILKIELLE